MKSVDYLPTYIRYIDVTNEEFELKLRKVKGIVSSALSISMNSYDSEKYNTNCATQSIEALVFDKIKSSEVSKRIFLYWYNQNEDDIEKTIKLRKVCVEIYSINKLIFDVQTESYNI